MLNFSVFRGSLEDVDFVEELLAVVDFRGGAASLTLENINTMTLRLFIGKSCIHTIQ